MYDSIGAKRPVMIGFVIAIIGIVMLLLTTDHSAVAYVIAAHVILMIGCPLAMSPAQTSALNALRGPASSDGSTILNTMQQIVGALATALATSFLELAGMRQLAVKRCVLRPGYTRDLLYAGFGNYRADRIVCLAQTK